MNGNFGILFNLFKNKYNSEGVNRYLKVVDKGYLRIQDFGKNHINSKKFKRLKKGNN